MSATEIGRAFVYYQSHTQRETAAFFGVSQSTICSAFRRVFGVGAVRDAEATWKMKRTRPTHTRRLSAATRVSEVDGRITSGVERSVSQISARPAISPTWDLP